MPSIYLSPSLQPFNEYLSGGSEQYYMNLLADAMEPYLISNGITFNRNEIGTSLRQSINASNSGNYDLHLALHSNASPDNLKGTLQGPDVYYSPYSYVGQEAAEIIAENLKNIYPDPSKSNAISTTSLSEINNTLAPAVLVEIAYHDNEEDEAWIKNNIDLIAANLVESLTYFFDIPFISIPMSPQLGYVMTQGTGLNLRSKPAFNAPIIAIIPNQSEVLVLGNWNDWYVINYNGQTGYVYKDYIVTN